MKFKTSVVFFLSTILMIALSACSTSRQGERNQVSVDERILRSGIGATLWVENKTDKNRSRILVSKEGLATPQSFTKIPKGKDLRVFLNYTDPYTAGSPVIYWDVPSRNAEITGLTVIDQGKDKLPVLGEVMPGGTGYNHNAKLVDRLKNQMFFSEHEEEFTSMPDDDVEPLQVSFYAEGPKYVGYTAEISNGIDPPVKGIVASFEGRGQALVKSPGNLKGDYTVRLLKPNGKEVGRWNLFRTSANDVLNLSFSSASCSNGEAGVPRVNVGFTGYWWPAGITDNVKTADIRGCEPNWEKPWYQR